MITRLWPLTLLVTQIVLGYDHKIDLERCGKDTNCFVRESCLESKTDDKKLVQYPASGVKLDEGKECSAVLQIKTIIGQRKLHVMMQVKLSGTDKIKSDAGLIFKQEINQFVCKPGSISGSLKFKFELVGQRQIYSEEHLFCSFSAEFKEKTDFFLNVFQMNTAKPELIYTKDNGQQETVEVYPQTKDNFWKKLTQTCDREIVNSLPNKDHPTDKGILLTEVETTFDDPKCSIDRPGLQSFTVLKKSDPTPIETSKVVCAADDEWKFDAAGTMTPIITVVGDTFEVYCSEKVCRKCVAPPRLSSCAHCAAVEAPPPPQDLNKCSTLTCHDNKKWTISGKDIIEGSAECRRSKSKAGEFAWFVGETELTGEAGCMDKLDCTPKVTEISGTNLKLGTNSITCNPGFNLTLHPDADGKEKGEVALGNVIECDIATGHYVNPNDRSKQYNFKNASCIVGTQTKPKDTQAKAGFFSEYQIPIYIVAAAAFLMAIVGLGGCIWWRMQKKKDKKGKTEADTKQSSEKKTSDKKNKSSLTSTSATGSAMSAAPGGVDGSEGKKKSSKRSKRDSKTRSKKSKKEDKFKLEDYETWDNEAFTKKILPNFNTASVESRAKWLRNHMCRFYAYCNTKKTPECGTFNQFWLLVKKCMDDKCEDGIVWTLLWRSAFTMAFSVIEKTSASDEFRLLVIKPFEGYMVDYLKKCDLFKRKDESRSETEMRVICIEILLHTRHPDVTEELRKLTFNEKLEVPLRMLTAACLTRERDENKASAVVIQFKRVSNTSVLDPHINEGWGTYLQHCIYGLGAYNITEKEVYQDFFFDAMYQVDKTKDEKAERRFSPTDWLYAFKGALLHENSAKIALDKFKKLNDHCLLHIEVLLKKNHEDPTDLNKTREMYKLDMKEYTLMLADLLVGEEEYNDFQPHLRFVAIYVGEHAKTGEPLDEERIRERAINMGNMVRDRNFFKESCDSLKAIGAKNV